jgi:undecaprenyl-diphosphatase
MATLIAIVIFLFGSLRILLNKKLFLHISIITLITAVFALTIKFYLEKYFDNKMLIAFCFITNAAILFSIRNKDKDRTWRSIGLKDSLILGILQGIAPLPGISRSGITIVGLLFLGFDKKEAFRLSFLMAIPVILGAFVFEYNQLVDSGISYGNMLIGFLFCFISGLFALMIVKRILLVGWFRNFAYYCLTIGLLTLFS